MKRNVKKLYELAGILGKQRDVTGTESDVFDEKDGFSMTMIRHRCGTPCCIYGWMISILGGKESVFQTYFGGDRNAFHEMCYPMNSSAKYLSGYEECSGYVDADLARRCVIHYAETGEVDWDFVRKSREAEKRAGGDVKSKAAKDIELLPA